MGAKEEVPTESQPVARPLRYGWFWFTPACLRNINTPTWFLVFMCIANIFQSMTVNGLIGVVLSSLETRFGFTSSQSSWIASAYDVSTVPVLALLSYFGSRSHRPRWTAAGLFLLVIGTLIIMLPHFTTPIYDPNEVGGHDDGLCDAGRNSSCTGNEGGDARESSLSAYLGVFIIGRVLHGLGAVPLYTIAVTFMDDTVSKEQFSFYIGRYLPNYTVVPFPMSEVRPFPIVELQSFQAKGLLGVKQPGSYQGGEMIMMMIMMKSVLWWRKPEYPEETTDLRQVTDETFHTYGLCPVRGLNLGHSGVKQSELSKAQ